MYAFHFTKCYGSGHFSDIRAPVGVRAEATADNTSIRVSWEWSHQGVPMCIDLGVRYHPERGSVMMYNVGNTTATSATLPNLQCSTVYTIWVYAESGSNKTGNMSAHTMVSLPVRGMYVFCNLSYSNIT